MSEEANLNVTKMEDLPLEIQELLKQNLPDPTIIPEEVQRVYNEVFKSVEDAIIDKTIDAAIIEQLRTSFNNKLVATGWTLDEIKISEDDPNTVDVVLLPPPTPLPFVDVKLTVDNSGCTVTE